MKPTSPLVVLVLAIAVLSGCASCGAPPNGRASDTSQSSLRPAPDSVKSPTPPGDNIGLWSPTPGVKWQLQLTGEIDASVDAEVFDVDGFDVPASTVAELQADGRRVICYFSAGTFEDWRPDSAEFPSAVLGAPLDEWPGERWLDIRQLDALRPIMAARLDMCRAKNFDAVDPDNMDGYANHSGFSISSQDQLRYNRMIADLAHERGLGVGLKNDLEQVADLVDDFDFAVNEQCAEYGECEMLDPFVAAGKAVLHVEYNLDRSEFCSSVPRPGFSSIRKRLELGPWLEPC